MLACYEADVLLGERRNAASGASRFRRSWSGPKRTALAPDELIVGREWRVAPGVGSFSKIGTRNAMVIAVASLCLVLDEERRAIRVALGSVGPTVLRAPEAEAFAAEALAAAGAWDDPGAPVADDGDRGVRRAGRRGGPADRRRARLGRVPAARLPRPRRAGAAVGAGGPCDAAPR